MAWLYKRANSANWWIGWRANGRQFLETTGETDKKKAEEKLREFEFLYRAKQDGRLTERFIESLTGSPVVAKVTLKAAIDSWLLECKGTTAPGTMTKYRSVTDELCRFLKADDNGPMLRDITPDVLRAFLTQKRSTVTASTANVYRTILSVFFIRELKNERIRVNPVLPVKSFKESRAEGVNRRSFTLEELKNIYGKAPNDFWRYMILGGFYTGLRLGDLVTMPKGAVSLSDNTISILTRKTNKTVHIPIAGPFRVILEPLIKRVPVNANESDPIWPEQAALYERHKARVFSVEFYDQILVPAGLAAKRTHEKNKNGRGAKREYTAVSFHSLRHTNVTFLKATGSTSAVAKALVGHSSDDINEIYTHLPLEVLTKAVNQLPAFETCQ